MGIEPRVFGALTLAELIALAEELRQDGCALRRRQGEFPTFEAYLLQAVPIARRRQAALNEIRARKGAQARL